jgi:hypothetical protein
MNPADVDDLVQSFIADKILEGQLLRHAEQRRGRFRSFLLTCLNNFLRSRQRGKQLSMEPLTESNEPTSTAEPASACLDAEWARSLLHNVLEAMHEECQHTQRQDVWAVFDKRILAVVLRSETPEPYERLAAGAATPSQVANLLVTAKRMYARLLRHAIAEYEATDEGIDQEIGDLYTLLSTAAASSAEHRDE